jgi:hypothetical protein
MSTPEFIHVQKFLGGIDYPVDRDQLVEHARDRGADDEVLRALEAIDDRQYRDPTDVSEAVAQAA